MTSPLVSVLMPCYNAGPYLRSAVDSVLAQTFRDFELICVDDGSTDATFDILRSYGGRVRVLQHPGGENRGQAASMNRALSEARGGLVALVDADDLWHPDKLRIQVEFLDAHPGIDVVYTNGAAIDSKGAFLYDLFRPNHVEASDPQKLLMNCYISAGNSAVLMRRAAVIDSGGWNETLQAQDHDMWLRLMEKHRFAYIPENLMSYRKHGAQSSLSRRQWENGFEVLRRARCRYPYSRHAVGVRRAVIHYRLSSHDVRNKRYLSAAYHAACSVVHHPSRAFRALRDVVSRIVWRTRKRGFLAMLRSRILPD